MKQVKSKTKTIRLSDIELTAIEKAAKADHLTPSAWMRQKVLNALKESRGVNKDPDTE